MSQRRSGYDVGLVYRVHWDGICLHATSTHAIVFDCEHQNPPGILNTSVGSVKQRCILMLRVPQHFKSRIDPKRRELIYNE
jgi:hypothetical protein